MVWVAAGLTATVGAAWAQGVATVPLLDPANEDLAILEAFGLLPSRLPSHRPLSRARAERMVEEARVRLAADTSLRGPVRADLGALLDRLDLGPLGPRAFAAGGDLELGGGRAPGRSVPAIRVGEVDGVVQPLWSNRGGRAYGDEATAAATAWLSVPLGGRLAAGIGGRAAASRSSGLTPGRDGLALERAYVRALLGPFAFQAGRARVVWDGAELLFSPSAPSLDLVRLSTERPVFLPLLGALEVDLSVADMGSDHTFPHALLFAARFSGRLAPGVRVGVSLMNKQGGEGAPSASLGDRLKDLTFVWDLFRRNDDFRFSDKIVGADLGVSFPTHGLRLEAELALSDFDHERLQDTFVDVAGYRVEARLGRLGPAERHEVGIEGRYTGPLMYRHHQFASGHTLDGHFLGLPLGPDGKGVTASYLFRAPSAGWRLSVDATLEERRADEYSSWQNARRRVDREETSPAERRTRLEASWERSISNGPRGIELRGGLESVSNVGHASGVNGVHGAVIVRLWWGL